MAIISSSITICCTSGWSIYNQTKRRGIQTADWLHEKISFLSSWKTGWQRGSAHGDATSIKIYWRTGQEDAERYRLSDSKGWRGWFRHRGTTTIICWSDDITGYTGGRREGYGCSNG